MSTHATAADVGTGELFVSGVRVPGYVWAVGQTAVFRERYTPDLVVGAWLFVL